MPFSVTALPDLRTQARARFAVRLGSDPTKANSNVNAAADAMAGMAHEELRYLSNMALQLFVETCDGSYLDRIGARYSLPRIQPATAIGEVSFTGTAGIPIPSGVTLTAPDGVTQVETGTGGSLSGSPGTLGLPAIAVKPGAAGNLASGTPLQIDVAIAGVYGTALVGSAFAGGADLESDDAYRARILFRQANPPRGGAASDYYAWMRAQPGVTRGWVFPLRRGAGSCDVAPVFDGRGTGNAILPTGGDIAAINAAMAPLIPVTANRISAPPALDTFVFALVGDAHAVTITGMIPNTSAMQTAVAASLADLFATAATPGGAALGDGLDANHTAGSLFLNQIEAAITAAGAISFDLTAPGADITSASGHIPTLGTLTFA